MKHSLTYYITLLVIRLKGIKKTFSKDPVDFKKVRKEDVRRPKGRFFKQHVKRTFQVAESMVTEVGPPSKAKGLLVFIHGGAFISGPAQHHWDSLKALVQQTNRTGWLCDYPKAPEHKINAISQNIDAVYAAALEQYSPAEIVLVGDSVGGTLIAALLQRLVQNRQELPARAVLVSPVMDASLEHPDIDKVDQVDPMLSKAGVRSAKKMCAENGDLEDVRISPLRGSFSEFPPTTICIASHDITYPDQLLSIQKMQEAGVDVEVIEGNEMPHIWPFLPVMKEGKLAFGQLVQRINS